MITLRPPAPNGLLDAVRALGSTLAETACVRGALFAVELREEVAQHQRTLAFSLLAGVFFHLALVVLTVLLAAMAWDTPYRVSALAALSAFYMACGGTALLALRHVAASRSAPFAGTLGELDHDVATLRAR